MDTEVAKKPPEIQGPQVHVERTTNVLFLTLNRPMSMNALDEASVNIIAEALRQAQSESGLCCVVIRARGRAFCAGADLKAANARAHAGDATAALRFIRQVNDLINQIAKFPTPVIALVQGLALAGGLELLLACDLVIATETAKFGDAHAKFGLLPGGGRSVRLPRRIGATRAKYMMFTAELIDAKTMHEWGLVTELSTNEASQRCLDNLIASLTAKSPIGLRRMKQLLNESIDLPVGEALERELEMSQLHSSSFDRAEGLAAFNEKRQPRFTGH
jgi:enoyl-CoA hydratase